MSSSGAKVIALMPREAGSRTRRGRKTHVRLHPEARARLMADLTEMDSPGKADDRRLAHRYAISQRTVEGIAADVRGGREIRNPDTGRVLTHVVPEDTLDLIAAHRTAKEAWRHLVATGRFCGSYSTFSRQVNARYGRNVVLGACRGTIGMRNTLREKLNRDPFMHTYTIDLFSLRAPLRDGNTIIRPMAMLVREDHTGFLVNSYVFDTDAVTAEMVGSVLGQAIRGRTYALADGDVFIGGLPDLIRCDNGSILIEGRLNDLLAGLGVRVHTINSYASHENGAHERTHRTSRDQLLRQLPGSSGGPVDERGRLMDDREPLTLAEGRRLLAAWVWRHNTDVDVHGTSPLQRWLDADPEGHVVRVPAAAELARLAIPYKETCRRDSRGVLMLKEHYFTPELTKLPAKRFTVRRWFGDPDHVELFDADDQKWIGTATRNGAHTAAESQAMTAHRAQEKAQVVAAIAAGNRRSEQILPATAAAQPPIVTPTEHALPTAAIPAPLDHLNCDGLLDGLTPPPSISPDPTA